MPILLFTSDNWDGAYARMITYMSTSRNIDFCELYIKTSTTAVCSTLSGKVWFFCYYVGYLMPKPFLKSSNGTIKSKAGEIMGYYL